MRFPSGELANVGRVRMVLAMTLAGPTLLSGCSAGAPPAPSAPGAIAPGNSTKVGGSFDAELLPQNFWFTISSPESMWANTIKMYCRN